MKLFKTLLIAGTTLPATIVPMTTMTSCGQSWGKLTPMSIGSTLPSDSPYSQFNLSTYLDADEQAMTYLQSNYTIKQSSGTAYAYSLPYKLRDEQETEEGIWDPASAGWYNSTASALSSYAKHKYKTEEGKIKSKIVTNARNAVLSPNIDFVATIAASINSYLDLALQYEATQVGTKKELAELDEDLGVAWGNHGVEDYWSFDHGEKGRTDEQNNEFYEFVFALSNLIGARKSHALFRTANINFTFDSMPIPSYTGTNKDDRKLNTNFLQLIEGSDSLEGGPTYYSSKSKQKHEKENDNDYYYNDYTYESVPVVVSFKDISKTYLDPCAKASSFLVNDYYSTNNEIFSSVGNRWQNAMHELTNREKSDCKPHYKTITLTAQGNVTVSGNQDQRIPQDSIKGNDFIVLVNYGLRYYHEDGHEETPLNPERNKANILGVTGFMPAYLLNFQNEMFGKENWLFKRLRGDEDLPYIFNRKRVAEANSWLLGILKRTSDQGKIPRAAGLSETSKKVISLLGYLFYDGESINTDTFLSTSDIEEI